MGIFKREVKLSTEVQLKTVTRWLIHKDRLIERQDLENYWGFAIIITIVSNLKATYFCAKELRFGEFLIVVKRY